MNWNIRKDREMIERMAALESQNIQLRQLAAVIQARYERAEAKLEAIRHVLCGGGE